MKLITKNNQQYTKILKALIINNTNGNSQQIHIITYNSHL